MDVNALLGIIEIPDSFLSPKSHTTVVSHYHIFGIRQNVSLLAANTSSNICFPAKGILYSNFQSEFPNLLLGYYKGILDVECSLRRKNGIKGLTKLRKAVIGKDINPFFSFSEDIIESLDYSEIKRSFDWDNISKKVSISDINLVMEKTLNLILEKMITVADELVTEISKSNGEKRKKHVNKLNTFVKTLPYDQQEQTIRFKRDFIKSKTVSRLKISVDFRSKKIFSLKSLSNKKFDLEKEIRECQSLLNNNEFLKFNNKFSKIVRKCSQKIYKLR